MIELAVIGNLSRDVVADSDPRPGGGVFWSTRALARIGEEALVSASCSAADRALLLPPLEAFGLPVTWHESSDTTAYSFHYEGDRRIMWLDAVGDPWTPEQATAAAGNASWVNVCALTRTDFSDATLAALAEDGRSLLVDLQGLVRTPTVGPLHTDEHIGDVLRHIEVLKLNDEEAETLVGGTEPERLQGLAPEVILTLGSRGAWVVTPTVLEHVPAVTIDDIVDPTGAGDTYSVVYLVHRARGAEPVEAARVASETVSAMLAGD